MHDSILAAVSGSSCVEAHTSPNDCGKGSPDFLAGWAAEFPLTLAMPGFEARREFRQFITPSAFQESDRFRINDGADLDVVHLGKLFRDQHRHAVAPLL